MFAEAAFAQRFIDQGSEPQTGTPAQLSAHMRSETERWTRLLKTIGLGTQRQTIALGLRRF